MLLWLTGQNSQNLAEKFCFKFQEQMIMALNRFPLFFIIFELLYFFGKESGMVSCCLLNSQKFKIVFLSDWLPFKARVPYLHCYLVMYDERNSCFSQGHQHESEHHKFFWTYSLYSTDIYHHLFQYLQNCLNQIKSKKKIQFSERVENALKTLFRER